MGVASSPLPAMRFPSGRIAHGGSRHALTQVSPQQIRMTTKLLSILSASILPGLVPPAFQRVVVYLSRSWSGIHGSPSSRIMMRGEP